MTGDWPTVASVLAASDAAHREHDDQLSPDAYLAAVHARESTA